MFALEVYSFTLWSAKHAVIQYYGFDLPKNRPCFKYDPLYKQRFGYTRPSDQYGPVEHPIPDMKSSDAKKNPPDRLSDKKSVFVRPLCLSSAT